MPSSSVPTSCIVLPFCGRTTGSRQSEIEMMAPLFIETARLILERMPEARFVVPLVTRETRERFEEFLQSKGKRITQQRRVIVDEVFKRAEDNGDYMIYKDPSKLAFRLYKVT